jgi:hypothetical protein
MIIPHLNSHGKCNGGVGYVKDEICPYVKYLTLGKLSKYLTEINKNTNVKWFKYDGRYWIHAINFLTKHQKLNESRLGRDLLPSYTGLKKNKAKPSPLEVEVKDKEEVKVNGKGNGEGEYTTPNPMRGGLRDLLTTATKPIPRNSKEIIAELKAHKEKNGAVAKI